MIFKHTIFAIPVRKTRLAYVDVAAKPPREVRRSQARHGTAGPTVGLDPLYKLSSHGGVRAPRAPMQHTDPTASQQRRGLEAEIEDLKRDHNHPCVNQSIHV
ncbi:hypothetical protein NP493_28g03006 [Ridgeia piscesae]|uniref:Uncharacterized protein n=1 Tax=Ridgeia piscesae TaxID=27915 RepID=A0AAD9UK55_RIDPI|nr:hypothetical protein NP493_28g03006 [Ridgeia piscesae]